MLLWLLSQPAGATTSVVVAPSKVFMTVADLITAALTDLGILQGGEVPSPDDQNVAFLRLNDWIDDLKTQGLSVFSVTRTTWPITGAASYSIGIGADINVDRPLSPQSIGAIGYIDTAFSPAQERLTGPVLTEDDYSGVPSKTATGTAPVAFYYNPTFGATGYGTILPFPIAAAGSLQGVIYTGMLVAEFLTVNDLVLLPPGYRRFLRSNLAIEIAGAFNVATPPASVIKSATESAANIKVVNVRISEMGSGVAGLFRGGGGAGTIYNSGS